MNVEIQGGEKPEAKERSIQKKTATALSSSTLPLPLPLTLTLRLTSYGSIQKALVAKAARQAGAEPRHPAVRGQKHARAENCAVSGPNSPAEISAREGREEGFLVQTGRKS